ncbi:MAG: hypothetical protein CVU38_06140, partial [Chloroflexi bacterium HGW-Chloroflexi-1]
MISRIRFEMRQIEWLFDSYADLLDRCRQAPPDLVEMTAAASVLHAFYNGLENIFLAVAKELDGTVPAGSSWHRDLLVLMSRDTPQRRRVISEQTGEKLAAYLTFRHFFRHSYSFFLDWSRLEKLVIPLWEVWEQTRQDLES